MDTRLLMTLRVTVAAPQNIGAVPHGTRRTAPLSGGSFEGPRLRGTVLPGGSADWLLLRADGVLELDLRATLRTDDGALVSMRSFGLCSSMRTTSRSASRAPWPDTLRADLSAFWTGRAIQTQSPPPHGGTKHLD